MAKYEIGRDVKDISGQSAWKKYVAAGATVVILGAGAIEGIGYNFKHAKNIGKDTIGSLVDSMFPQPVKNLQKMPYKVGDVINGRKITGPAVVAEIVSENPTIAELGETGNPVYLTQLMNDFPENNGYRNKWNTLQENDVFTGINWKTPYVKK
jgi:hypothetical protein